MQKKRFIDDKKAQILGLPFSVIFSIILIVFFIIAAIIAIKVFYGGKCAFMDRSQQALYKQELQSAIDEAWNSERSISEFKKSLSAKITHVCFLDVNKRASGKNSDFYDELILYSNGKDNFFFYPPKKACNELRSMTIAHINMTEITSVNNPYCKETKASLMIEKSFYDALVKIT